VSQSPLGDQDIRPNLEECSLSPDEHPEVDDQGRGGRRSFRAHLLRVMPNHPIRCHREPWKTWFLGYPPLARIEDQFE